MTLYLIIDFYLILMISTFYLISCRFFSNKYHFYLNLDFSLILILQLDFFYIIIWLFSHDFNVFILYTVDLCPINVTLFSIFTYSQDFSSQKMVQGSRVSLIGGLDYEKQTNDQESFILIKNNNRIYIFFHSKPLVYVELSDSHVSFVTSPL